MKKISTLILILVASSSVMANIPVTEKEALLKLFKATKGINWTNKWDLNAPISSWYGVKLQKDKVISFGYFGVGRWDNGKIDEGELMNIKNNFTTYLRNEYDQKR